MLVDDDLVEFFDFVPEVVLSFVDFAIGFADFLVEGVFGQNTFFQVQIEPVLVCQLGAQSTFGLHQIFVGVFSQVEFDFEVAQFGAELAVLFLEAFVVLELAHKMIVLAFERVHFLENDAGHAYLFSESTSSMRFSSAAIWRS